MAQKNITLFDADGLGHDYEDSTTKTDDVNYLKVTVSKGIWILYRKVDFNDSIFGGSEDDIVILKEPVTKQKLPFPPRSIFRCEDSGDSCTVFEHSYYGGTRKQYQVPCPKVSQGASSIIIWPNKHWELFTGENFTGGSKVLKPGWYPTPAAMEFPNDKLCSLRPC